MKKIISLTKKFLRAYCENCAKYGYNTPTCMTPVRYTFK